MVNDARFFSHILPETSEPKMADNSVVKPEMTWIVRLGIKTETGETYPFETKGILIPNVATPLIA